MSLQRAEEILHKRFKKQMIGPFSKLNFAGPTETISTGSLKLDLAIGRNEKFLGIPRGRITILWGRPKSGKSTLVYDIIANVQEQGGLAALIDTEFSFDAKYAESHGVDVDNLKYVYCFDEGNGTPLPLESIWEIVEILVRSKEFQVIVIDSLDYMMPRVELEGVIGESHMGKRGFLNGQAARKLVGPVRVCNTALIFVSQVRYKLGVLFGSPETMSGGQSIQHWCGLKIDMRGGKHIKDAAEEPIGQEVHIFIPWNKIARPFAKETLEFYFDGGFTKEPDILEYGAELGLFKKRSSYYYFTENEKEFVQGRAKAIQYLKNNPDVAESLEAQIREGMGGLRKEKGLEPDSEQGQESEPSA